MTEKNSQAASIAFVIACMGSETRFNEKKMFAREESTLHQREFPKSLKRDCDTYTIMTPTLSNRFLV